MKLDSFPFHAFDWSSVPKEEHVGETGTSYWQVKQMNQIRIRKVEYSANYKADHWCSKGHIVLCIEGEMNSHLADGRIIEFTKGMSYFVGDNNEAHQSSTETGCTLFIVD